MKKISGIALMIVIISFLLSGCGEADIEGIVLEVNEQGIKLATELSPAEYEAIKNESVTDIQNKDVSGETHLGLIDLDYDDTDEFNAGDEVMVWIYGEIATSYPEQAKAKKITFKN